jgi:hypothetical protein
MSDSLVALLITLALLASMLVWVPLLEVICPPCSRFLVRLKLSRPEPVADSSGPISKHPDIPD